MALVMLFAFVMFGLAGWLYWRKSEEQTEKALGPHVRNVPTYPSADEVCSLLWEIQHTDDPVARLKREFPRG